MMMSHVGCGYFLFLFFVLSTAPSFKKMGKHMAHNEFAKKKHRRNR